MSLIYVVRPNENLLGISSEFASDLHRVGDETQFEIEDSNEVLGLATSHCPFEV